MPFTGARKLTERGVLAEMLYRLDVGLGLQWFGPLVFKIDSTDPNGETHNWLGGVPGMSERKGDPTFAKPRNAQFAIVHKPWQCGLLIPKEEWLFNKSGMIQKRTVDQVDVALGHPGELVQSLISSGEATACYDGQYFFDTDHSEGKSGTQSNDITTAKAGTTPTASEMKTAILNALAALWGFKDDQGNLVNVNAAEFTVGVPTALYPTLLEAIGLILVVGGNTNILNPNNTIFKIVPQMLPNVTGNKLYVARRREALMGSAFIYQVLMPSEPVILGIDSEYCKQTGNLLFKVEGTYNMGYGRWQDIVLVTFTGP